MNGGYYWELKVVGRKYDPSQPRVPVGSPEGGRWTSSSEVAGALVDPGVPAAERAKLVADLEAVPLRHLKGINTVTTKPHRLYTVNDDGGYANVFDEKKGALGCYDKMTRSIHVSPKAVENKFTLIHEVGHHISMTTKLGRKEGGWVDVADQVARSLQGSSGMTLARMGLRNGSVQNGKEFLADAYFAWLHGSDDDWTALNRLFRSLEDPSFSLEILFGRRGS